MEISKKEPGRNLTGLLFTEHYKSFLKKESFILYQLPIIPFVMHYVKTIVAEGHHHDNHVHFVCTRLCQYNLP